MELKFQWIETRRQQLLKDITQCDQQSKTFLAQLITDVKTKEEELIKFKQTTKLKSDESEDELMKVSIQVKSLEAVIASKQEQLDRFRQETAQLTKSNQQLYTLNQEMSSRILHLEHALILSKEQTQKQLSQIKKDMETQSTIHSQELSKLVKAHEQELLDCEKQLTKNNEEVLSELKKVNLKLLQKMETQYQTTSLKNTQANKQNETDYARVTHENTKLITTINDLKRKTLDLEGTLSTVQQQHKISLKEAEIIKDNNRRQLEMLRQDKNTLKQKNKALTEKVDQLAWQSREMRLSKQQELKKVRQEVDRSFEQILSKAEEESKGMSKQNQFLKTSLTQKENTIQELQKMCLKFKTIVEDQQKEFHQLRTDKQNLLRQTGSESNPIKQNEQLRAEIVRKNCQMQVLQQEIKRLKGKVNKMGSAYEQYSKVKQLMEKENKMLLSEIIFLREKEKKNKGKNLSSSNILNDLNSEQSGVVEDVEEYKKIIQFMTEEMNEASKKIIEKDLRIEKLEAQVKRFERQLQNH